jgi:hypothetical protein
MRKPPVQITPQTLARQPAGKPYVIDLARKGKIYAVTADVASRVRIHTADGEIGIIDLMKKTGDNKVLSGSKLLLGSFDDLRASNFGRPLTTRTSTSVRAQNLNCGPVICECDPDVEGDCDGRKYFCASLPMVCYQCDGPACSPSERNRWTCFCIHI